MIKPRSIGYESPKKEGDTMDKKVVVFTSNTCPYCNMAKEYLNDKNVDFEEKNIQTDKAARDELMKMGHLGVPVILVGDEEVVGFDQQKLDDLLA